jgi:pyruvate dehydrogenase E2 component (dihydrolipoamide acetyltransferase)
MPIHIDMPKLSDTMTEGTLIKWHKKIGDTIEIGDVLAEIETDNATMEMEAFDDGVLTDILVAEGQKAAIGSTLAVLNGNPSHPPGPSPAPASGVTAPLAVPPAATPAATTAATPAATPAPAPASVVPAVLAASPVPVPADAATAAATPAVDIDGRVKASPFARKLAEEFHIDLSNISGTGPGGRIVAEDINAAAAKKNSAAAPSAEATAAAALSASIKARISSPSVATGVAPQAISPVIHDGDEAVQLSSLRKITASRLLIAKQTIPHFYLHLEADAAPLTDLRKLINDQTAQTHGNKYSLNDFILLAVVQAIKLVPAINSSFANDSIVNFKHVGLTIAVAIDEGLVTPVVKQAETKSLLAISREVKDLAIRAKERKLKPNEFDGGTITISNLGAWGIESFDAIINPPQAAILSIGAVVEKPVVKDGKVVPGLRMDIGLSCDHRVIDGAKAAQFLAEVKRLIEHPALMLL